MRATKSPPSHLDNGSGLTWEIAQLFPAQGDWSEDEYLDFANRLEPHQRVEFANGTLEVLPMPTEPHQLILRYFYNLLDAFVVAHALGLVLFSGMNVRTKKGRKPKFRCPDILFLRTEHFGLRHKDYWDGADLVMEVVSESDKDRRRDLVTKRREYAKAGIAEYWIIDPRDEVVYVFTLRGKAYRKHGAFGAGETADSVLLAGCRVVVDDLLSAGQR